MSTSAAFTPSPPLSPKRQRHREQILQLANRRGWLVAPSAASVVKACHSAWKAGTLPEVSFIPSPSSSEHVDTLSESTASSIASYSSDSSHIPSASDQIDLLCDTLKDMDFQGDKNQSAVRTSLKSGVMENQKILERLKEKGRRDPISVKQQQMKSLSITSRGNSQHRNAEKNRVAAIAAQNFVSSHTSPLYNSSGSQLSLPTHTNTVSRTQGNLQQLMLTNSLRVPQNNIQQLAHTNPLSPIRSDSLATSAAQRGQISSAFKGQQHMYANLQTYATTAPINPRNPRGNNAPRKSAVPQRSTGNSEHQALKNSHQWLHPGPFFKTRDESAKRLLRVFDLALFNGSFTSGSVPKVTLEWNRRLNRTAGQTRMKRHALTGERRAVVVLSTKVIDEPVRLYKTMAHELCHAAAWIIDNTSKPPHGDVFKAWGERFRNWDHTLQITRCHDYKIHYKYNYKCVKCGKVYGRHSKSIDTSKKVCGVCKSALQLSIVP